MNNYKELRQHELRARIIAKRSIFGEIHCICEDITPYGKDNLTAEEKVKELEDAAWLIMYLSMAEM